jgi:hypothetical protein
VPDYQKVDMDDLVYLAVRWLEFCGQDHCQSADINLDSQVNLEDFAEFAENWLFNSL